jgi:hypothetical protein
MVPTPTGEQLIEEAKAVMRNSAVDQPPAEPFIQSSPSKSYSLKNLSDDKLIDLLNSLDKL